MLVARLPVIFTLLLGVPTAILLALQHLDNVTRGSGLFRTRKPDLDQHQYATPSARDESQELKRWFWHPDGQGPDGPPPAWPTSSSSPEGFSLWCSCWNVTATRACCQRAVLTAHKMGNLFMCQRFRPYKGVRKELSFNDRALWPHPATTVSSPGAAEYRHVALVRDVGSALVSGYLYHKSGHECWLDFLGNPAQPPKTTHAGGWEAAMLESSSSTTTTTNATVAALPASSIPPSTLHNWDADQLHPFPAVANRSLCQYLADESEEDGLQMYMGYVLTGYYAGMVPYLESVRAHLRGLSVSSSSEEEDGGNRNNSIGGNSRSGTLFVCLEDVSNPVHEPEAMDAMLGWLYPGGDRPDGDASAAAPPESEGHRSDHSDVIMRKRLLDLVQRLDREVFGGAVARLNGYLDCAETVRR